MAAIGEGTGTLAWRAFGLEGSRDFVAPPDSACDGFVQAVGRLLEGAGTAIALSDSLGEVWESDGEPAYFVVRRQYRGVCERVHLESAIES